MAPRNPATKTQKPKTEKRIFKYFAPDAGEVCLAGTFNNWCDKELFLKKDKSGFWTINLPLPQGRYEYRFIVDGNWANDQEQAECIPNPFGTWNSVVQVSI